jgi:ubiquinone/menaquinone biosynthesis C-methylase UbiE
MKNLTVKVHERQKIEREFHDKWAKNIKCEEINYKGAFEAETAIENRYALSQLGNLKGKRILDLGCGMGDASLYFASQGAKVYSIDISPEMIKLVKKVTAKKGFSKRIIPKVMLAEKLNFPKYYFDFVYGNGVLHHVEIDTALKEVFRVLKKGGVATFIEPLSSNPVIRVYRNVANEVRTPTEHPLVYTKLNFLTKEKFKKVSHREFHLFTLLIFIWYYLVDKVSPNKERYWKKIINDASHIKTVFQLLKKLDEGMFKILPFMRRYSWNTVLVYRK